MSFNKGLLGFHLMKLFYIIIFYLIKCSTNDEDDLKSIKSEIAEQQSNHHDFIGSTGK